MMRTDDRLIFEAFRESKIPVQFQKSKKEDVEIKGKGDKPCPECDCKPCECPKEEGVEIAEEGCPECEAHIQDAAQEISALMGGDGTQMDKQVVAILTKYFANDQAEAAASAAAAFQTGAVNSVGGGGVPGDGQMGGDHGGQLGGY